MTLEQLKRQALVAALTATKGRKGEAADLLSISRRTVYRWIELYGIEPEEWAWPRENQR